MRWLKVRDERHFLHLIAAVVCVGCLGPFTENIERRYADTKSAIAAGALGAERWLPEILPDDAVDIHEVHNIDTNLTWGCFKTQNLGAVRAALLNLMATETRGAIHHGPSELFRDFSWWPDSMRSSSIEARQFLEPPAAPALEGFVVRVGIDPGTGTVCFHRTR